MGCGVWGTRFRSYTSATMNVIVRVLGSGLQDPGFGVSSLTFRAKGFGFRV